MSARQTAIAAAKKLARQADRLTFAEPVTHVYNPLRYAWKLHEQYLHWLPETGCEVLFLGMNPGPWGMAQTGVPFGQVAAVRDWLRLDAPTRRPRNEHPKRPVEGLDCPRSEVSGERLWGLMQRRFGEPGRFFQRHFIANYCPLVFMEASARNRTPDKLPAEEREPLAALCDAHLQTLVDGLAVRICVGVGAYAERSLLRVCGNRDVKIVRILHPSPASPAANRGWAEQAERQLIETGVW